MKNFGKIKNAFNNVLVESIGLNDLKSKSLFNKYTKTIKESEILKTQFLIYSNIETKVDSDLNSINLFIGENFKLLEKYNHSDILKENQKLLSISKLVKSKVEEPYDEKLANLHESISKLIFMKKSPSSVNNIVENISKISNYIILNEAKVVQPSTELPTSFLSGLLVDKFNEKYKDLNESTQEAIKAIFSTDKEVKKTTYTNILRECIDTINEKFESSDLETKEQLLKVKNKLLDDDREINENFEQKILKLVDLRDSLAFD